MVSIRQRMGCGVAAAWAAVACLPAAAITGKVVDPEGSPLAGATACLMVGNAPGLCSEANADGVFELMDAEVENLRVSAAGFVSRILPAVTHDQPIVLARAATLRVRLLDASTGEPIERGEVAIAYPSGDRRGPFPVNRFGLIVDRLAPDEVLVLVEAQGYRPPAAKPATLTSGRESAVVVEMDPIPETGTPPDGDS